jgi:hypothetical protein
MRLMPANSIGEQRIIDTLQGEAPETEAARGIPKSARSWKVT